MLEPTPPEQIPEHLVEGYSYGGRVRLTILPKSQQMNQRYVGNSAAEAGWTAKLVDQWAAACMNGSLEGSYGAAETVGVAAAMAHVRPKGAKVLVVGSERPWVEACLVGLGAVEVVTIEYGGIISTHPKVTTMTPAEVRKQAARYMGYFDAVVSHSSLEHSGLGRYGDAMNPWGDRQATARAWCMTRKGGRMLVGVPEEPGGKGDMVYYNQHRYYGPLQLAHLSANWKQVWSGNSKYHRMVAGEK